MILFQLIWLAAASWGNVLVLEYEDPKDQGYHGEAVSYIACRDSKFDCELFYETLFDDDFVEEVYDHMDGVRVVNMSFGFQKPDLVTPGPPRRGRTEHAGVDYVKDLESFENQKNNLQSYMDDHPEVLFTLAAGNGFFIGNISVLAVPNGPLFPSYPAVLQAENRVSVAAVKDGQLADYSNFSLFDVELAALVEEAHDGGLVRGTSFAAPYVARLAGQIVHAFPQITTLEIKEILMKSSKIKNLDLALWATEDYLENGMASLVYKIHTEDHYQTRERLRKELGDILLVKSGGVVNPEVTWQCVRNYLDGVSGLSIEQACLNAQTQVFGLNPEQVIKTSLLWKLRGF